MSQRLYPAILAAALLLGGCGGSDGAPDERCANVLSVPTWQLQLSVTFSDTGSTDSAHVRLHHSYTASGTTGHAIHIASAADGREWLITVPSGTLVEHDTVINSFTNDTVVGTGSAFTPRRASSTGYAQGVYLSVNLATCAGSLVGAPWALATLSATGFPSSTDSLPIGQAIHSGLVIDSDFVANGVTLPATKVITRALGGVIFPAEPYYFAGGLVGPYAGTGTQLDSATVSWTVTPAP